MCDQVSRFTFQEFTRHDIGSAVFRLFDKEAEYRALCSRMDLLPRNVRLTDDEVERRYVATFLRLGDPSQCDAGHALHVDRLVTRRLEMRSLCRPGIRRRFEAELGSIPPSEVAPAS